MLILARKVNESITIGEKIEVTVIDIKGDQVKLGIIAPRDIKVFRREVYDAIQRENQEASQSATTLPALDNLMDRKKKPAPGEGRD
ncbi:MAG: carbon storage regulator CsrA [Spirochaetales bacterium]|jgi:carbon storage regulator|nr:carbon storage regulator CsrA [Spirochaetales bacterium]